MDISLYLLLIPVILCAYVCQTMLGFGGAILALGIGAHFAPVGLIVGGMLPLSLMLYGYLALRHRRRVPLGLLVRRVLPALAVGLAAGLALLPLLEPEALKRLFAVLVMLFALREGLLLLRGSAPGGRNMGPAQAAVWQVMAGVTHAFYTTGGPMLVYSLSRMGLDKGAFRASLCAIWLISNSVLVAGFIAGGRINAETLILSAWMLPVLPLGIWLGERLHGRVSEDRFKLIVYGLLFVSGLIMACK